MHTCALPDYQKANILVLGDVMLDRYWHGTSSRISPEAPVPVVAVEQIQNLPGAAANVAVNLATLGAKVCLFSMTGEDSFATQLESLLHDKNIHTVFQKISHLSTIRKLRILSQHQQLLRLDFDENFAEISPGYLIKLYQQALHAIHIIILSDYGKGVLACAPTFIQQARQANIPVIIDPKGEDYTGYQGADILTPNLKEFELIVGKCPTDAVLTEKALKLIQTLQLQALLVTRGEDGMSLIRSGRAPLHLSAKKQAVFDVTGAGDTVISVLSASLASGTSLEQAVTLANIAAGITVSKLGATGVALHELRRAVQQEHAVFARGILTEAELLACVQDAKAHGEKIVMTNGCFDILHPGHIAYLKEAKKLGDYLIVAVNTDASVKQLKGDKRPINSVEDRMKVLSGLSAVDWIVSFADNTPERLIQAVLPDVLVKGGDYTAENIAGYHAVIQNGGQVKILDFHENYSSSRIIRHLE